MAAGHPDDPAPAFRVRRARAVCEPLVGVRCALAVFRCEQDRQWHCSPVGRFAGWVVRSSLTCRAAIECVRLQAVTHSSIEKTQSPSSSTRRAGVIGVTGSRARGASSQVSHAAVGDLAARAGSCTDASFSAVFRYPPLKPSAAQPDERFFPLVARVQLERRARAPRPAALMGFGPSQV